MKRITSALSILLILATVLGLCACTKSTVICASCSAECDANASFCSFCGAILTVATDTGTPEDPDNGLTRLEMGDINKAKLNHPDSATVIAADNLVSKQTVLVDLSSSSVQASRLSNERIYPASMVKVMTLVVVVEQLKYEEKLQDVITISEEVMKRMQKEGASGAGLEAGEQLTVESLLYALILKSDGIAACELANYVAGSETDFADLMNQKATEMGLTNSHFVNPTGLHDELQYSTCRDIAAIMAYAMSVPLCKKILSTQVFVAPCVGANGKQFNYTFYHSLLVTQFDKFKDQGKPYMPSNMTIIAGKTGYTPESGFCLVTCAKDTNGNLYVCVTAGAASYAECVQDYRTVYGLAS